MENQMIVRIKKIFRQTTTKAFKNTTKWIFNKSIFYGKNDV